MAEMLPLSLRKVKIDAIEPDSIAEEIGLKAGDVLLSINGEPIRDMLDYLFHSSNEELSLLIESAGVQTEYVIEKYPDEEIGLVFTPAFMQHARRCANNCVFCFIDQLPPGMRKSLYFKDDDSRLSFMQGNFVTLTNVSDQQLQRIVRYGIHPINVSIHSFDTKIRRRLIGNKRSDRIEAQLDYLAAHQVHMNGQIVLVPDYNDGEDLTNTLEKLLHYYPHMQSVAVVPVGLSRYREKLTPLRPFTKEEARQVIRQIEQIQRKAMKQTGSRFAFAADEFYLKAEQALPTEKAYESYIQLENGVGMVRRFLTEFNRSRRRQAVPDHMHYVTGTAFYPFLKSMVEQVNIKYNKSNRVTAVQNRFFGEQITVGGLLTYRDIVSQVQPAPGETLALSELIFNTDGVTLDDYTIEDFQKTLQCEVVTLRTHGHVLVEEE